MYIVRKAKIADVPQIYELLKELGEKGLMLPRSLSELYDVIRSFVVACSDDDQDKVIGAVALHVCWEDLGEIRSLAVSAGSQGADLGARMLEVCFQDALELGLTRLFVLTYIPRYFEKFGFYETDKARFPQKIWAACLKCINFPECGEIAMERSLV